jgi:hypothetical protein
MIIQWTVVVWLLVRVTQMVIPLELTPVNPTPVTTVPGKPVFAVTKA